MATLAHTLPESHRPATLFWEFLKEELAPYPGRFELIARMVLASTLIMIFVMTLRIPFGAFAAIYALFISRESPGTTLQAALLAVFISAVGAAYVLVSAYFFVNNIPLHFLWTIGTSFLVFYAFRIVANYFAVLIFAIQTAIIAPGLWDRHVPAEANVESTLWALLAYLMGGAITALVEFAFAQIESRDDICGPLADRLASVEALLTCYSAAQPVDLATEKRIIRFALLGTSRLRDILRRRAYSRQYGEHMGAWVSLVARLVDIAANLTQLSIRLSDDDRERIRTLTASIAGLRADLLNRRVPHPIKFQSESEAYDRVPLLCEMETTTSLIPEVFSGSEWIKDHVAPPSDDKRPTTLFVSDALTNPDHFKFALKGCLAAGLCYIIYNAIDWPGISTAVTTCVLTALSTIGGSHQKQVLRFAGAIVGGFLLGMGSQIFILPHVDSIAGFTVLFVLVTSLSAWIITSSPRLSYFGLQIAVAFYLVNLQEFAWQTSLSVARDRVVGILLGLLMMWLVFDQLWGTPSGVEIKNFISSLRVLAQLAREPFTGEKRLAVERSYVLRDSISANFEKTRAAADGVLLEFGPTRQQDLALRSRIRKWQPQMHALFVTESALLKYRFNLPGFELPESVRASRQGFDNQLATILDGMASRMEGAVPGPKVDIDDSFARLEQTVGAEARTAGLQTFLTLYCNMESVTSFLDNEI